MPVLCRAPPLPEAEAEFRCITEDKTESCWGLFTDFSVCLALSLFRSFAICSISFSLFSQCQWILIKMIALFSRESSGLRSTEKYIHYNHQHSAVAFNTKCIRTREPRGLSLLFYLFCYSRVRHLFFSGFRGDTQVLNVCRESATSGCPAA